MDQANAVVGFHSNLVPHHRKIFIYLFHFSETGYRYVSLYNSFISDSLHFRREDDEVLSQPASINQFMAKVRLLTYHVHLSYDEQKIRKIVFKHVAFNLLIHPNSSYNLPSEKFK